MKYSSYSASGIDWLPDIPSSWKIVRIKDIAVTRSGTTPQSSNPKYYCDKGFNWVRTTDLNNGNLFQTEFNITELAFQECGMKLIPNESVLVAMYGGFGTIGKNAILKKTSTINQSVCAILPSKDFHSKYLLYFLKYFRPNWKLFADGTRKDPNINQEAIKNLFVIYPSFPEQIAIANYLDKKTTVIDKKIELLEQKVLKYEELKKALINETVCRGLDKEVEFVESGIDWIGKIPKHWKVKRFKDFARTIKGKNLPVSDKPFEGSQPLLSLEYLRNKNVTFDSFCHSSNKQLLAANGDLVIVWDGAAVGEIIESKKGFLSSTIAKLNFDEKKILARYFYYMKDNLDYTLKKVPAGMGIPHLNPTVLNQYNFPIPPLNEQKIIFEFLDKNNARFISIQNNINTQIIALKELRTTLINDVVTGKIKVSE